MRKLFVLIPLLAACSGDPADPATTTPPPVDGSNLVVEVRDDSFGPARSTAKVGQTVRWTWRGSNAHNVTFSGGPASPIQTSGTFERTFSAPGTFDYHCNVHGASMSGSVTVTP